MRYYLKPKARRAKQVWEYATKLVGVEPLELWFNPNCWGRNKCLVGNFWGDWGCKFPAGTYHKHMVDGVLMMGPKSITNSPAQSSKVGE